MFVASGAVGVLAVSLVEVVCRHAPTSFWKEPSVANLVRTATGTFNSKNATRTLSARSIVKVNGVILQLAPPRVVEVCNLECTLSPSLLCMVVPLVPKPMVPWRIMNAALSSVRRIALVIGMIGRSAPMVVLDQRVSNVALGVHNAGHTMSHNSTHQEGVVVLLPNGQTRQRQMWTPPRWTPENVSFLAALNPARESGDHGASAQGQM